MPNIMRASTMNVCNYRTKVVVRYCEMEREAGKNTTHHVPPETGRIGVETFGKNNDPGPQGEDVLMARKIDPASYVNKKHVKSDSDAEDTLPTHLTHSVPNCVPALSGENPTMAKVITNRVIDLIVAEMNKEETQQKIKWHIIKPLIRLIYSQMSPYLVMAAIVVISGIVMWILMFTMFTLSFFRGRGGSE